MDFDVAFTLGLSGDLAAVFAESVPAQSTHTLRASSFDDCARETTIALAAKPSDGVYGAPRTVRLEVAPASGADPRIDAATPVDIQVVDDTITGPLVTHLAVSPEAPGTKPPPSSAAPYSEAALEALEGNAHGSRTELTFTVRFDQGVRVTGRPRLVLDVGDVTRYATYSTGSGSNEVVFTWTVSTSDVAPEGLRGLAIELPDGASINEASDEAEPMVTDLFRDPAAGRERNHRGLPRSLTRSQPMPRANLRVTTAG